MQHHGCYGGSQYHPGPQQAAIGAAGWSRQHTPPPALNCRIPQTGSLPSLSQHGPCRMALLQQRKLGKRLSCGSMPGRVDVAYAALRNPIADAIVAATVARGVHPAPHLLHCWPGTAVEQPRKATAPPCLCLEQWLQWLQAAERLRRINSIPVQERSRACPVRQHTLSVCCPARAHAQDTSLHAAMCCQNTGSVTL